jgi:3-isopropylmalate/(R)-2-methylmalate dehydratase large subunit
VSGGPSARYEIDEELSLDDIVPMIAKPFSPGNAFPAAEVARERITFDKALIGSCTNGSYDDLLQAALVIAARAPQDLRAPHQSSWCFQGPAAWVARSSAPIRGSVASRSPTSFARSAGEIRQSWCGPCFGQGPDALLPGQRAITSFNRNWQNRMGVGGEGYLASPAIVAASALAGYMAPPSELGLKWQPDVYGV